MSERPVRPDGTREGQLWGGPPAPLTSEQEKEFQGLLAARPSIAPSLESEIEDGGYFTLAEELRPWRDRSLFGIRPEGLAMIYQLAHGPTCGQAIGSLTVGINIAHLEHLAGQLGWDLSTAERCMAAAVAQGMVLHDRDAGVSCLLRMVQPARNASHFLGAIHALMKKTRACEARDRYLQLLVEATRRRAAEKAWGLDKERLEEIIADLPRKFPGAFPAPDPLD